VAITVVDTHAHLDDPQFCEDLDAVLERAAFAGVSHVVSIGTTATSSAAAVALSRRYPMVVPAVGLQPNNLVEAVAGDWDQVVSLVAQEQVVAVGETGLDRHWQTTPFSQQEEYFARHLELARTSGLPVVIHCREAEGDVVRMIREDFERHGPVLGVMHSFTGDADTARVCVEMGLFISVAGMVTFKNAQALREVARSVPRNRLLIETDSPYLAPVPVRGRRNEPAHVVYTLECLAKVRGEDMADLARQTTDNAAKVFRGVCPK
jgi:TatD DNase family protein